MPDLEAMAAKRFMKSLVDDKVARLLGEVVRGSGAGAALKRDPAAHLAKAGLPLPRDVTVTLNEESLKLDQLPRELRLDLDQTVPVVRIICFRFCRWYKIGRFYYRRCVLICVLG